MPYVSDQNLDEQNQNQGGGSQAPAGQISGQPSVVSGSTGNQSNLQSVNTATETPSAPTLASGSGVVAASGQGTGGKSAAPSYNPTTPTDSGNWTNLQNYINANNGGNFGNQFSGNIQTNINQAQSDTSSASSNFQNAVNQGTVENNQNVINEVTSSPDTMSSADQSAFESQLNGSYSGPQNAVSDAGFTQAQNESQNAFNQAQEAQNPSGQQTLLTQFYNTPSYSAGEKNLDSAILSTDPNAQAALQSLQQNASTLPVNFQNAENQANNEVAAGQAASAANSELASSSLYGPGGSAANPTGGAIGDIVNSVNQTYNQDLSQINNLNNLLQPIENQNDLTQLTPDQLAALGITANQTPGFGGFTTSQYDTALAASMNAHGGVPAGTTDRYGNPIGGSTNNNPNGIYLLGDNLEGQISTPNGWAYGVNPMNYASIVPVGDLNPEAVASQEQIAQLNALSTLAGQQQDTFLPASTNPSQYYNTPVASVNQQSYQQALQSAEQSYENAMLAAITAEGAQSQSLMGRINSVRAQYGLSPVS